MTRPAFEIDKPYWLHPDDRRQPIKPSRVMSGKEEIGHLMVRTTTTVDVTLLREDLIWLVRKDVIFWKQLDKDVEESELLLDMMAGLGARLSGDEFVMEYQFPAIHSGMVAGGKHSLYRDLFIVFKLKRAGVAPDEESDLDPNRLCIVGTLVDRNGWEIGRF